jgi:cell division protease FtsH
MSFRGPGDQRPLMPSGRWFRRFALTVLVPLGLVAIVVASIWPSSLGRTNEMPISELIRLAKAGQVATITVTGDALLVQRSGSSGTSRVQRDPRTDVYTTLEAAGVPPERIATIEIVYSAPSAASFWGSLLIVILPVVAIVAVLFFVMRRARGPNETAMSFGKSRARRFVGAKTSITFADVAGVEEAKQELQEIVEFLKYPEKFSALGAKIPHGVLLIGPPGTGKTLIAKAVAGEAGVPFFSISGSEFVEMFVGVGASRARDLFDQAKKQAPCIVFVDEIDAVGRQRGAGLGGGNDEREQTLNQILVEMDGFDTNTNVIVIAATNRPDVLDPALLRPGRFDRQVMLDRPDINGRTAVLNVHSKGKPLDKSVVIEVLAKQTAGFSGADLANVINEAAILAARRDRKTIGLDELEEAVDRVVAGPARRSRVVSDREKEVIAYHEAGHAIVARHLSNLDPLHKVTIIPRGSMGGYTRLLPTEDRYLQSRTEFEETLVFALGGRVAEEMVFAEVTTGAGNDIQQATALARQMVTGFGMSARLGPVALRRPTESIFVGRSIGDQKMYSQPTAEAIDDEIRAFLDAAATRAGELLTTHRDQLDRLARALVEHETLAGEELEGIFTDDDGKSEPAQPSKWMGGPVSPADGTDRTTPSP